MKGRTVVAAILASALAGCSSGSDSPPVSAEIMCAAEALRASRRASSPAEQNLLLSKATIFEQKLPASRHDQAHRTAETLADRASAGPLVEAAACEALLSPADRERLQREKG